MASPRTCKVKALVNIKYDKTIVNEGEDFKVKKADVEELVSRGFVELLEDDSKDGEGTNDDGDGDGEKEGGE